MPAEPRTSLVMWLVLPAVALAGGAIWWPIHQQNKNLQRRIERTERKLADARRTVEQHDRLNRQIQRMRNRLDGYRRNVPEHPRLSSLFASLTGAIEQLGLRDPDLSSGSTTSRPPVRAMPIRVTFTGDAVDTFNLLRRIETMPRLIQPTLLRMQAPDSGMGTIQAELELEAFFHGAGKGER